VILIRFESDGPIRKFSTIAHKRLKPLTTLSGAVYKLASSMSDHKPVLFNMFEEWNEKSVVLHAHLFLFHYSASA